MISKVVAVSALEEERPCIMFTYWGRRGAMAQFALDLGRAALASQEVSALLSISRQNENFDAYTELGPALCPVDTFRSNIGAVVHACRIPRLRRLILEQIKQHKVKAVIELMPHAWSRFAIGADLRRLGVRYATIIHDAEPHPGDWTAALNWWLDAAALDADVVLTLSAAVAQRLKARGNIPSSKIRSLFHPELGYGPSLRPTPPATDEPLRLLFLGRIMAYKGLSLFLDAVDEVRNRGVPVQVGVFGEGKLGRNAARLDAMGAEVVNRWLTAQEVGTILRRFHAVVLSHIEASQSGVAAAAMHAGLPVVATPVGGLTEQITDGVTGLLAKRAEATALSEAIVRLRDPDLYRAICDGIAGTHERRSMATFVKAAVSLVLNA